MFTGIAARPLGAGLILRSVHDKPPKSLTSPGRVTFQPVLKRRPSRDRPLWAAKQAECAEQGQKYDGVLWSVAFGIRAPGAWIRSANVMRSREHGRARRSQLAVCIMARGTNTQAKAQHNLLHQSDWLRWSMPICRLFQPGRPCCKRVMDYGLYAVAAVRGNLRVIHWWWALKTMSGHDREVTSSWTADPHRARFMSPRIARCP